ncbi:hypothetical protein ABPG72_022102 [Tetrahymena utriculariae]
MNFLYIKIWVLHIVLVYGQDQIPFQTQSNVFWVVEKSSIIYKSFINPKWRYSIYDENGTIQHTYIIEGLQDLVKSYYLLDNDMLYLFTLGASNYQIVDLNLLTSKQNSYLSQTNFFISQCQQNGAIMRYGTFYFFICLNPTFYLQEQSFEALKTASRQNSYSQYIITQDYLMFDQNLLAYKENIFSNLGNVQSIGYILLDLQYDLFLQNNTILCKALLDVASKKFSCINSYDLHLPILSDFTGSKVFFSNGLNLIFCLDLQENYFKFFNVENLNLITRTGVGINLYNQQLIQNGYIFYTSSNSQYTAIYNPFDNTIDIQEVFTNLPTNYYFLNNPYYNFNFQKGSTIFLKLNSETYLLNINQIYKMCQDYQLIQPDSSCGSSCPSYADFRFSQMVHVAARMDISIGECWKQFEVSNSDVFTQSKVNQIKQQVQMTSQASSASTQILTSIYNVVSSQSFGLISNFIVSQNLCYLFLVDVILPPQIYYSLLSNKDQCSPLQYKFFNVLEIITNESELQYQNPKYKELGLFYNIMKTSGSAAILFAICLTVFIIFYLVIQHVKIKIFQTVQIAYNRLFCGTLIQYFQICSTIFIIGINQQIKEFFLLDKDDIEQFKLKIIFCIISLAICILVFFFQSFFLNNIKQNEDEEQSTFKNVTKQMIQNGAISEDILKRNFMLIYLLFESFVIPTLFIQLSQYWIFICTFSILTQLILVLIIIFSAPFISKLQNTYFIINSLLWLAIYIQYFLLDLQINQYISIGKNSSTTTDTLSFIFLTTIYLILLWYPLYICIALLVFLYDYIKQKKQKSKESSHFNYLGQINHPSLITINENFKKLNINYYLRESLYSDYFNELVSSKTWMRSRNHSKNIQKDQDLILTKQI